MTDRISSLDNGYKTGDLSIFPEALDDKRLLFQASNNSRTPLAQTLTYNSKIVIVKDTSGFPPNGIIRIGQDGSDNYELIAYEKKTGTTFQTLQRGFAGSKQTSWQPQNVFVTNSVNADYHNSLKDAVINIETDLGVVNNPDPDSLNGILKAQEVRFLAPKPLFRAYPPKGTPPHTVRFQNFTTGYVIRYLWDFGDGGTSLDRNPTHTYLIEGKYTVKLNIITSTGAQGIATKSEYITVDSDESIPFFYVDSINQPYSVKTASELTFQGTPVDPKTFLFVDQTDGDIVQRNWIFGDGTNQSESDPNIHTVTHTFQEPGTYTVTELIIFNNGRLKKVELTNALVVL